MNTAKTCTGCDETKPLAEFHAMPGGDGYRSKCKDCRNVQRRGRYQKNPGPAIAASSAWRTANPGVAAAAERRRRAAAPERHRAKYTRDNHVRRARKVNAAVGPVDVVAAMSSRSDCYLCGLTLADDVHLDHVIPLSRGGAHAQANLLPTHSGCNLRKHDALLSELTWYAGPTDLGVLAA